MDHDVFISYSRVNLNKVKAIKTEIEQVTGARCWMDLDGGIESGEPRFTKSIIEGIESCTIFLFMRSLESQSSKYALLELNYASEDQNRHVVIVNIDNSPMNKEFRFLYGLTDTIQWDNRPQHDKLLTDLKKWIVCNENTTLVNTVELKDRTFTVKGVSFKMSFVEGGTFMMGATAEQVRYAYSNERPAHKVYLSDYFIGETQVTQELWKAIMKRNPYNFDDKNCPMVCVSWNDCQKFLQKLNEITRSQLPTGRKFHLPTEAEWEFAARGGTKSKGYLYSGSNVLNEVGWFNENSKGKLHPVKQKKANELGIYDMSGNVWEWCQDWWSDYDTPPLTNPQGPDSGSYRVYRGGSYNYFNRGSRVSMRLKSGLDLRAAEFGFRLAL